MSDIGSLSWKEIFTIGAAGVGAVLGIMNTWNSISARRLRLRVTPHFVHRTDGEPLGASIEIINLSSFAVTVAEAGFDVGHGRHLPIMQTQVRLPHRLDARESVSIFIDPGAFLPPADVKIGSAYARTACGKWIKGNSPAGRQLSKILSDAAKGAS